MKREIKTHAGIITVERRNNGRGGEEVVVFDQPSPSGWTQFHFTVEEAALLKDAIGEALRLQPTVSIVPVPEQDILTVLEAIDRGDVQIIRPVLRDCGCIRSETENGWVFWVFDDAGCWDYIERVRTPSGQIVDLWAYMHDGSTVDMSHADVMAKWKAHPTYEGYERVRDW